MKKINLQQGSAKIVVIAIVCFVVFAAAGYFFLWRPSNTDYDAANQQIASLRDTTKRFAFGLKSTPKATYIDTEGLKIYQQFVDKYQQSLDKLAKSPVT